MATDTNDLITLLTNTAAKENERNNINILSEQLKPLAQSTSGMFAIQDLLANPEAPKEQRAAAAQVLHPGLQAAVGANGELTFSNKPGVDVGTDYAVKVNPRATNSQTNILQDFDTQFSAIQNMTDSVDVMNAYANLQGSATTYINDKRSRLKSNVEQANGVSSIRNAIQESQLADKDHYAVYYGGVDQGPSQETLELINQLRTLETRVDQDIQTQLSRDPEVAVLEAKLKTLDSFVTSKYRDLQDPNTKVAVNLIPEEQVTATMVALGSNPSDGPARLKVAEGIIAGNQAINMAQSIGTSSPEQLINIAANGQGVMSSQAARVLNSKVNNPETVKFLVDSVKNFDTLYANEVAANKDRYQLSEMDRLSSPKQQEAAQQAINARKVQYVLADVQNRRAAGFASNVNQWQAPQDSDLLEINDIVQDYSRLNDGASITLDALVQRMNWTGNNRADKIKKLSNYINSQAATIEGNEFFGPPAQFSSPAMAEQYVQSLVIYQTNVKGFAQNINAGQHNFVPSGSFR